MCKCRILNFNILCKSEVEGLSVVVVDTVETVELGILIGISGVSVGENVEKLVGLYVELSEE